MHWPVWGSESGIESTRRISPERVLDELAAGVEIAMHYEGGCACGALRYESKERPDAVGYCHCRICQRTTAAPAIVFASFPVAAFRYVEGKPAVYASSAHGHREFCSRCGTQTAYRKSDGPRHVDVNVGSLDDPSLVSPDHHIWCGSRIAWFDTRDTFPRYDAQNPAS